MPEVYDPTEVEFSVSDVRYTEYSFGPTGISGSTSTTNPDLLISNIVIAPFDGFLKASGSTFASSAFASTRIAPGFMNLKICFEAFHDEKSETTGKALSFTLLLS